MRQVPQGDKSLYVLHGTIKTPPMSSRTRVEVGYQLRCLQQGDLLSMPESRPMPVIGPNCHELRISDVEQSIEWRVIYCIDDVAVIVLDVFKKTTQSTPDRVKAACRSRLQRFQAAKRGLH